MGLPDEIVQWGNLAALAAIGTFLWRLLVAVKAKAKFEQRVETHLIQTEPLLTQFHAMQTAVTSGELRHQEMNHRMEQHIEAQMETNRALQETLQIVLQRVLPTGDGRWREREPEPRRSPRG